MMSTTPLSTRTAPSLATQDAAAWSFSLATLQSQLQASESGLTSEEATSRLHEYGPNILRPRPRQGRRIKIAYPAGL